MNNKTAISVVRLFFMICFIIVSNSCSNTKKKANNITSKTIKYPSDVILFMDKWKILLGDGTYVDDLIKYQKNGFFYPSFLPLAVPNL